MCISYYLLFFYLLFPIFTFIGEFFWIFYLFLFSRSPCFHLFLLTACMWCFLTSQRWRHVQVLAWTFAFMFLLAFAITYSQDFLDFQRFFSLLLAFFLTFMLLISSWIFWLERLWAHLQGGFLSYAFEAHPEVLMGQFCWPGFGGRPSYLLVVNFKFQVSRWLFCFSFIIKSFSALMPKRVGGGISVVNQGWRKLSLILDCINRTVFLSFFF